MRYESAVKEQWTNPVVDFAYQTAKDWPWPDGRELCYEERIPALYNWAQQVHARGAIHPRLMLWAAEYFDETNHVPKLPKKAVLQVIRQARKDHLRGVSQPPEVNLPPDQRPAEPQVFRLRDCGPPEKQSEFQELVMGALTRGLTTGSDVEVAQSALRELTRDYGEVVNAEGAFWRYVGNHWAPIPQHELRTRIQSFDGTKPRGKKTQINLTKSRIDSILCEMAAMAAKPGFFEKEAAGINCQSGLITFSASGPKLEPHAREHRKRHVLPHRWQEGQSTAPYLRPRWDAEAQEYRPGSLLDQLLEGCFKDDDAADEKIALLQEVFGCALLGHSTRLMNPVAVVLHGQHAENGKSQVLDALRGLFPKEAVASIPPGKLGDPTFACRLAGKMLNAADELSGAQAIASDSFKAFVTGDPISARDVYKSAADFRPIAMHIFATNTLPTFTGGFDRGVRRRLLVIPFNRVVPKEERVEHIGARIAEEEGDLLLAWAIEGAARLIARRYFDAPQSCREALRAWIYGADPVLAWMDDRVVVVENGGKDARKAKADVYDNFKKWAKQAGFGEQRLPLINHFVSRVKAQDSRIGEVRDPEKGRCFTNLKLRSEFETEKYEKSDGNIFD